eukprot:Sdes_comp15856_c0_seq4m4944
MTNAFGKQPFSLYFSFLTGIRYSSSIQKCTLKPVGLLVEGRGAFQVGTFFIHKKFGYRGVIASREDFSHRKKLWLKIHKPGLLKGHNQPFYTALVDVQDFNHADNLLYCPFVFEKNSHLFFSPRCQLFCSLDTFYFSSL